MPENSRNLGALCQTILSLRKLQRSQEPVSGTRIKDQIFRTEDSPGISIQIGLRSSVSVTRCRDQIQISYYITISQHLNSESFPSTILQLQSSLQRKSSVGLRQCAHPESRTPEFSAQKTSSPLPGPVQASPGLLSQAQMTPSVQTYLGTGETQRPHWSCEALHRGRSKGDRQWLKMAVLSLPMPPCSSKTSRS